MLNINDRKYCFEVFGYDFFIDAEFNVWLIEINTNPCIEESCPLLSALIPRMLGTSNVLPISYILPIIIDDAFKLTVDVVFPPPSKKQQQKSPERKEKEAEVGNSEAPEKKEEEPREKKPSAKVDRSKLYPLFDYDDNENLW